MDALERIQFLPTMKRIWTPSPLAWTAENLGNKTHTFLMALALHELTWACTVGQRTRFGVDKRPPMERSSSQTSLTFPTTKAARWDFTSRHLPLILGGSDST